MTLSEELSWRGFIDQTSYKDIKAIDKGGISFYWGVDPSANSMTVGNLAIAMLVMHFMLAGHKAVLLVGGATGLIGDPDGKATERELRTVESINKDKQGIIQQYQQLFKGQSFDIVDNYDWFKDMNYLTFLREVGKHIPLRTMLNREFVDSRLSATGNGISYAEFSYCLIQAYDFLRLFKDKGVRLQLAGSDQWGNSIAGVDLIRRVTTESVDVWTAPLVVNKQTGQKFGKTEDGAIWLDPNKTTPTAFYQFWINTADDSVEDFLKIYTLLTKEEITKLMTEHARDPKKRLAQKALADATTTIVHVKEQAEIAQAVTSYLIGDRDINTATEDQLKAVRQELPFIKASTTDSLQALLINSGLAKSNSEAKNLISSNAIYINGQGLTDNSSFEQYAGQKVLIRRGKAFKDSALVEF